MSAPRSDSAWRLVPAPLVVSRLLWLIVVVAVVHTAMPTVSLVTGIRQSLLYWDAPHYIEIAMYGYAPNLDYHDAFLPGYPMLVRAMSAVTRDYVVAGWLVSLIAEAIALWYIARLVLAERDRSAAGFSAWLIALAPAALFFTALYTESAFVAAAAASLFYARRGGVRAAAMAGAVACGLRLTGLALIPALVIEQMSHAHGRPDRRLAWVLAVPFPVVLFCAYMQLRTGDALAYFHAQSLPSFNHAPAFPWDGLVSSWNTMATATDGETRSIFAREVAFGLLGFLISAAMWISRRIPRSIAAYCTLAWLLTASLTFWRSEPRYDLALFPAVLLVADLTARARAARPVLVAASGALMCAGVAIYAQGRWLG
jgi:Gpi18-like mannosyltransferase